MKNNTIILSVTGVLLVSAFGAFMWYAAAGPSVADAEVLSRHGLHWHPELTIYVKGIRQPIPENIGIGVVHNPLHTHDMSGTIHMEMQGLVMKNSTTLGEFFKVWRKNMSDFGTSTLRMLVNGAEVLDVLNYPMKDKDKIELYFE